MNDMLRQKLADLKAQQASGEHMVCPRCGLDRMKPELYTNALSREAGEAEIMVCDQCGTEEAMLAFMRNPKPLTSWACFQPERPAGDFKAVCGAEAWEEIRNTQLPFLSQLYERWQEERPRGFRSVPAGGSAEVQGPDGDLGAALPCAL